MAKDITIVIKSWKDGSGGAANSFPSCIEITIDQGGDTYKYLLDGSSLKVILDRPVNYLELSSNSMTYYKYSPGDTYATGAIGDAETMYNAILNEITA